jgi:hypothetical protein
LPLVTNRSVKNEVVLGPNTIELSDEENGQISSISPDGALITFSTITPELRQIEVGDVIIGGVSNAAPYGFLRFDVMPAPG